MTNNITFIAPLLLASSAFAGPGVSNYDDLPEGFLGTSFHYEGVTYSDANGVGGSFPSGDTFTAADTGPQLIIEDSTYLFDNFPNFGSRANTLTFGSAYIPGPNLSLGAFSRVTLTLDAPAAAASVEMAFYENGPWGGIVFHLDGLRNGQVLNSMTYTIANGGGRDNVTTTTLSVFDQAHGFDQLKLYATFGNDYSAPRLIIDNLALIPAPNGCPADFNGDSFLDFFDYAAFVDCFEGIECPQGRDADFNRDGFVDFMDFSDFVFAFEAGC